MSHWPAASVDLGAHARQLLAVERAPVEPFSHGGLRGGDDDPCQLEPLFHDDLIEKRRRHHVDLGESRELRQVVLIGGEVVHGVDPAQEVPQQGFVADVAFVEISLGVQIGGWPTSMDRRCQRIEDDHLVTEFDEPVGRVGADETGPAGHQDLHGRWRRRSATSR